ncbi:MAG: hypothetical protein OXG11_05600 [Chloroflexi bacterium]|nr:hypothetical protein [Chloroflexota bacterium]
MAFDFEGVDAPQLMGIGRSAELNVARGLSLTGMSRTTVGQGQKGPGMA